MCPETRGSQAACSTPRRQHATNTPTRSNSSKIRYLQRRPVSLFHFPLIYCAIRRARTEFTPREGCVGGDHVASVSYPLGKLCTFLFSFLLEWGVANMRKHQQDPDISIL